MVVSHHVDHILVENSAFVEDLEAVIHMPRHFSGLLDGQLTVRLQQAGIDPQFAHIHQHTAHRERAQVAPRQTQLAAQRHCPHRRAQ